MCIKWAGTPKSAHTLNSKRTKIEQTRNIRTPLNSVYLQLLWYKTPTELWSFGRLMNTIS